MANLFGFSYGEIQRKYLDSIVYVHNTLTTICGLLHRSSDIESFKTAFSEWASAQLMSERECAWHCLELTRADKPLPFDW